MPFEESNFSVLTKSNFSLASNNISGLTGSTPFINQGKKPQRFEYYEPVSENSNEDCANFQSQTQSEFNEQPQLEVVTQKQDQDESYLIEVSEQERGATEEPKENDHDLEEQDPAEEHQ